MDVLRESGLTECVAFGKGIKDKVAEHEPLTLTAVYQNLCRASSCGGGLCLGTSRSYSWNIPLLQCHFQKQQSWHTLALENSP